MNNKRKQDKMVEDWEIDNISFAKCSSETIFDEKKGCCHTGWLYVIGSALAGIVLGFALRSLWGC